MEQFSHWSKNYIKAVYELSPSNNRVRISDVATK